MKKYPKARATIFLTFCLISSFVFVVEKVFAQEATNQAEADLPKIRGGFSEDSLKVGKQIPFSIVFIHQYNKEVVFADSTYDFSPFEWVKTEAFPTNTTKEGISKDSAVYWLRSFEMDTIQSVRLPVFILNQETGDTLKYFTELSVKNTDFVLSREALQKILQSDSINFYQNTKFLTIPKLTNYPLYVFIVVVLIILLILFFVFFGESIRKSYRLKRLQRQHEKFIQEYANQLQSIEDSEATDHTLGIWKAYIEKLKNKPFTTYTSSEISRLTKNDNLGQNLKVIDRAIYGGQIDENTSLALQNLKNYAINVFEKRLKELRTQSENEEKKQKAKRQNTIKKRKLKTPVN